MESFYRWLRTQESRRGWSYLVWVPLLILSLYVALFGIDIPFGDPWATLLPHIVKAHQGTLTLADLLSQNNEHRPFFLRLILIPLAAVTRWNTRAEMGVQIGFAVATFLVIRRQLSLSWQRLGVKPSKWLPLIVSLLVFSLDQWENWLNGYQVLFSLFAFAAVSGLFLLANPRLTLGRLAAGILCAIVAQYTVAAGIAVWGLGLILVLITAEGWPRKAGLALVWLIFASLSTFIYFRGFQAGPDGLTLGTVLAAPHIYLLYVLTFLGAPVMTFYTAAIPGAIGVGLLLLILYDVRRRRAGDEFAAYLPYVALCGFSGLIALIVGVGRMGEKWWLALSPRYVGLSVWFWVGLVALLSLRAAVGRQAGQRNRLEAFWQRTARVGLATIMMLSLTFSVIGAGLGITLRYIPLHTARTALIAGDESDATLAAIYADTDYLRSQLPVLKVYHLSIYRHGVDDETPDS